MEHVHKLLTLVAPFLEYLDLVGWGKEDPISSRKHYHHDNIVFWEQGMEHLFEQNKASFPFLKGVKGGNSYDSLDNLNNFFQGLRGRLECIDMHFPFTHSRGKD